MDLADKSKTLKIIAFLSILISLSFVVSAAPLTGNNADQVSTYWVNMSGQFADVTTASNDVAENDTPLTGNITYFGYRYKAPTLNFSVTDASGAATEGGVRIDLFNGTGWQLIEAADVENGNCANFSAIGNCTLNLLLDVTDDWVNGTPSGTAENGVLNNDLYWIRIRNTTAWTQLPNASQASASQFNVQLNVTDELGNTFQLSTGPWGINVTTNTTGGLLQDTDNFDGRSDGRIFIMATNVTHNMTVNLSSGFVIRGTAVNATSMNLQEHLVPLQYGLKVTLADELGTQIPNTAVAASFANNVRNASSNNVIYFNDTQGLNGSALIVTRDGYVASDITNDGLANITTSTLYQVAITMGNFSENDSLTINTNVSLKGLEFGHRVNVTNELGTQLTNATVILGGVTCKYDAFNDHYYCNTTAGNDAVAINVSLDGYVENTAVTAGDRTDNESTQITNNVTTVLFSHRINATHELGGNLTNATVGFSGGSCTASGGLYYCAIGIAADSGTNDLNVTLDGYVEKLANSGDRTAQNSSQITNNLSNVRFAVNVQLDAEVSGLTSMHGATVKVGNSTTVDCINNGTTNVYFCAAGLGNTSGAVFGSKSGFVNITTNTTKFTARTAHNDTQVEVTHILPYGLRIIIADQLGSNLSTNGAGASFGGRLAVANTTSSAFFNNTAGAQQLLLSIDGYVDLNTTSTVINNISTSDASQVTVTLGNFTANTSASATTNFTTQGLQFAHRVNVTNELGTTLTNATVAFSGGISCSYDATTLFYYCAVAVGADSVAINTTLDGYVEDSTTSQDRTANSTAQQTNNVSLSFGHVVYATHELGGNLTNATVSFAGGGSCTASGSFYYCAIPLAGDAATNDLNVTLDGYVEALGTSGNRTAQNSSQIQNNITNARFALKVSPTREGDAGTISAATILVGNGSGVGCIENASTGNYYCAVNLANSTTVNLTKAGFVNTSVPSAFTQRGFHNDSQATAAFEVQFGLKVTVADELGTNFTGSVIAKSFRGGAPDVNTTNTFYWNDTAGSGGGLVISRDGYVDSNVTHSALSNISTTQANQIHITLGNSSVVNTSLTITDNATMKGIQFGHRVNTSTELLGLMPNATVVIGSISCSFDESTDHYYCAVAVASDAVTNDINVTQNGYVEALGTSGNRTANSSVQITNNITNVRYSHKITLKKEHMNDSLTGSVVTAGSASVRCAENGTAGEYFCYVNLSDDGGTNDVLAFTQGYVNKTGSLQNRTAHNDTQQVVNITDIQFAFRLLGIYDESDSVWLNLDGTGANGTVATQAGGMTVLTNYTNGTHAFIAANGSGINFTVARTGWVNRTVTGNYNSGAQQTIFIGNTSSVTFNTSNITGANTLFTVRVVTRDELSNEMAAVTVNVTNTTFFVTTSSPTNTSGNIKYFALDPLQYPTVNISSRLTGFVDVLDTNGSVNYTLSDAFQVNVTHNLSYTVKIDAYNELSTRLNLTTINVTLTGGISNISNVVYNGGFAYIPANSTQGTFTLAHKGYINTSVANNITPASSYQSVVNFSGLAPTVANGSGLQFTVRINVRSSVTSTALTGAGFVLSTSGQPDIVTQTASSSGSYYFAVNDTSYSTINITVSKDGYASASEPNQAVGTSSQLNLTFSLSGDTTAPGAPILLTPTNTSRVNTTAPVVSWSTVIDSGSGVNRYHIEVSNLSNFSSTNVNNSQVNTSAYQVTVNDALVDGLTYYWRVRAIDGANNTGSWSDVFQMTVNTTAYNFTYSFDRVGYHTFQFLPKTVVENNLSSLASNFTVSNVLRSINNKYTVVYHYNGNNYTSNVPGRSVNDLSEMNQTSPWYTIHMNSTGTLEIV